MALFGKAGVELTPVLKKVAEEGFDNLRDKAQRLGVYLDENFAEQAAKAKSDIADLQAAGEGAALQFDTGFLPAVDGVAKALVDLVGGSDKFRDWGVGVGNAVIDISIGFIELVKQVRVAAAEYGSFLNQVDASNNVMKAKFGLTAGTRQAGRDGAVQDLLMVQQAAKMASDARDDYNRQLATLMSAKDALNAPRKTGGSGNAPPGASGGGLSQEELDKRQRQQEKDQTAASAYQQSLADNQLALQRTTNQLAAAEDQRHYAAGLLTVDDYYDKVEARINQDSEAQLDSLASKFAAAEALPQRTVEEQSKRDAALAQIQTQAKQVTLKNTADLKAAEDDRAKAKHDNALSELQDQEKLQKATGDAIGAEQTQLKIELQNYTELLQKRKDLTDAQRAAMAASFQTKGEAKIGYGQAQQSANGSMQDMNLAIGAVQDQAANGAITQISAEKQILDLEAARLPALQDLADEMEALAAVSDDITLKDQAKAFQANVQKMEGQLHTLTTAQTYFVNQLTGQGYTDLVDFFAAGIDGSKSFGDALADLENSSRQS